MSVVLPSGHVHRFFQLLQNRNFKAAKIVLSRIQSRLKRDEWERGYFVALSGLLLGLESGDQRLFINNLADRQQHREEFLKHSQSRMHGEYDRGFFAAWADFCRKR